MVGIVFLVPSLILRRETWLDASSWCPDSSGEVEIHMLISFSLVEVNTFSAVVRPLYSWGITFWVDIAKPLHLG
ncbi:hypothetical protein GIB67_007530 [Kingdonia uniflora]|uniref:Uncharacterized protein n=1 Tax=Kingdonia uniflora TaxID=39325 RepID=A0A7J7LND7_9MAGN|nr:hypothetical protein GIB67_007530 [Kingdonia uniflora]